MTTQNKKAFTLVELIIVITILSILATIGFISFQSYTLDARDASRITTVKEISKGLDILYTKTSSFPMPDGTISNGTINGVIYAYRGTVGDTVSQKVRMQKRTDPMSKDEYMYGVNSDKTQYQVAAVLENNTVAEVNSITDTTYAAGTPKARLNGNYPGYLKYSTGGQSYIANIPSLLWNNSGSIDLMNTGTYFVVNNKTNLPYKLNSTTDLGSKDANAIIQEITGTGVATLTGVNITNINSSNISSTFNGAVLASFGGDLAKVTNAVIGTVASIPAQNTPVPFIPFENFAVTTYGGNGGTQNVITGLDMTSGNNGGLVWVKSRTETGTDISVTDSIRGNDVYLSTAGTRAEIAATDRGVYLNNSGIQVKASPTHKTNELNNNYVAWSWKTTDKASGVTNQGKAYTANYNPRAGFSIVGYQGSGLADHQIPHSLGTTPELVFTKSRDQAYGWIVHSKYIGSFGADYLWLEQNLPMQSAGLHIDYNNLNIIEKDGSQNRNQLDKYYISYAFTSIPGFSKIGNYIGNGGTGNKITLGFEPTWIMIKRVDLANDWVILDSKRGWSKVLWSDLTSAESDGGTTTSITPASDGFTFNGAGGSINALNGTYLYYAISK